MVFKDNNTTKEVIKKCQKNCYTFIIIYKKEINEKKMIIIKNFEYYLNNVG